MFVDDKMISCVAENGDQAIQQLNKALKELYPWCLITGSHHSLERAKVCSYLKLAQWGRFHPSPSAVALSNWLSNRGYAV